MPCTSRCWASWRNCSPRDRGRILPPRSATAFMRMTATPTMEQAKRSHKQTPLLVRTRVIQSSGGGAPFRAAAASINQTQCKGTSIMLSNPPLSVLPVPERERHPVRVAEIAVGDVGIVEVQGADVNAESRGEAVVEVVFGAVAGPERQEFHGPVFEADVVLERRVPAFQRVGADLQAILEQMPGGTHAVRKGHGIGLFDEGDPAAEILDRRAEEQPLDAGLLDHPEIKSDGLGLLIR